MGSETLLSPYQVCPRWCDCSAPNLSMTQTNTEFLIWHHSPERLPGCLMTAGLHSVQFSRARLFATPWIAARQASLFITNPRSSLKLTSIESVMPSRHLILCRSLLLLPQSLPASESFPMSQLFAWGGQTTGVSALASVLPMNTQDWSPLGWTGWI